MRCVTTGGHEHEVGAAAQTQESHRYCHIVSHFTATWTTQGLVEKYGCVSVRDPYRVVRKQFRLIVFPPR